MQTCFIVYRPKAKLMFSVSIIVAYTYEYLCSGTVRFIVASRLEVWWLILIQFLLSFILEQNIERVIKIGPYLPKLLQK